MPASGFTPIISYHSTTASAVPIAANMQQGELAINVTDKKIYTKNGSNVVVTLTGTLASQDASSVTVGNLSVTGSAAFSTTLSVTGTTTLATSLTGMLKAASGVVSVATAGTDYAGMSNDQTFTGAQRGAITTDNDLSFNLSAGNNFNCTPAATGALTFTSLVAGQSGYVLLNNSGGYAISAAATTKVSTTFLAAVSTSGVYLISYFCDGTNVYCTASGALS